MCCLFMVLCLVAVPDGGGADGLEIHDLQHPAQQHFARILQVLVQPKLLNMSIGSWHSFSWPAVLKHLSSISRTRLRSTPCSHPT